MSAPKTPIRSLPQRMEALSKANMVRNRRAQVKKEIKSGDRELIDVLKAPPEFLLTAKVFELLMAAPKFGRVKASRALSRCRISQSKTVGGLSDRQRDELIKLLVERAAALAKQSGR